jgi:16S rRNA (guanine527-N7)-methyltransferase
VTAALAWTEALRGEGCAPDADAARRCEAFLALLAKWNRTFNLTAIRDPETMVSHHLLDSLSVLPHLPRRPGARLLDMGSGGGLPGLPIAIVRGDLEVTLLDSNAKKTAFIQQAIAELGLSNARVVTSRAESFVAPVPYDAVISRAFADLATFARLALPLLAPDGRLLAMKGALPADEIAALPPGVTVEAAPALAVPGLAAQRHLVILKPTEGRP